MAAKKTESMSEIVNSWSNDDLIRELAEGNINAPQDLLGCHEFQEKKAQIFTTYRPCAWHVWLIDKEGNEIGEMLRVDGIDDLFGYADLAYVMEQTGIFDMNQLILRIAHPLSQHYRIFGYPVRVAFCVLILGINGVGQCLNNLLKHSGHLLTFIHNSLSPYLNLFLQIGLQIIQIQNTVYSGPQ